MKFKSQDALSSCTDNLITYYMEPIVGTSNVVMISPHLNEDLRFIKTWVRDDLFNQVKFLPKGKKDLEPRSLIHKKFVKKCKNSLPGVKANSNNPLASEVYAERVWELATRRHIVSNALALRRSGVYTVMQNRFYGKHIITTMVRPKYLYGRRLTNFYLLRYLLSSTDLCTECSRERLVFPALEAFEERLKNPTMYYLFYEYFIRSTIGDEEWKLKASATTTPEKRMATPYTEAFTFIILKNNYFAWLLHAKQLHQDLLVTDYDEDLSEARGTLVEHVLQWSYLDLRLEKENDFFVVIKCAGEADCTVPAHPAFEEAKTLFKIWVEEIREKVKYSSEYSQLNDSLTSLKSLTGGQLDERSRKKKRRKILKDLKPFTGVREAEEKAFRGWSDRAFVELGNLREVIENEASTYQRFEKAYKHLYAVQRQNHVTEEGSAVESILLDGTRYNQFLFDFSDDDEEEDEENRTTAAI